jgi:hypothetical protein
MYLCEFAHCQVDPKRCIIYKTIHTCIHNKSLTRQKQAADIDHFANSSKRNDRFRKLHIYIHNYIHTYMFVPVKNGLLTSTISQIARRGMIASEKFLALYSATAVLCRQTDAERAYPDIWGFSNNKLVRRDAESSYPSPNPASVHARVIKCYVYIHEMWNYAGKHRFCVCVCVCVYVVPFSRFCFSACQCHLVLCIDTWMHICTSICIFTHLYAYMYTHIDTYLRSSSPQGSPHCASACHLPPVTTVRPPHAANLCTTQSF